MRTILEIYFGINLLLTGYWVGDSWTSRDTVKEKLFFICNILFCIFFGSLYIIFQLIIEGPLHWIDQKIHISFYWNYFILNQYRNIPIKKLKEVENFVTKNFTTNSISDRIQRHIYLLIIKRNNYDTKPNSEKIRSTSVKEFECVESFKSDNYVFGEEEKYPWNSINYDEKTVYLIAKDISPSYLVKITFDELNKNFVSIKL